MLDKVISVCSTKDINTWEIASDYIVKYIAARRYTVIVPDSQVREFENKTNSRYEVIPESDLIGKLKNRIEHKVPENQSGRVGWYLQQFIKLFALSKLKDEDVALIWDADTVPLKALEFISDDGKLRYYIGNENHAPYFDFISKLLDVHKKQEFSFIAQCFPIRGAWAKAFFQEVECCQDENWVDSFLNSIDFNHNSGFSEYETLGSFIYNKYPQEIMVLSNKWSRLGNLLIGSANNLEYKISKLITRKYDYISFESWDDVRVSNPIRRTIRKIYHIIMN